VSRKHVKLTIHLERETQRRDWWLDPKLRRREVRRAAALLCAAVAGCGPGFLPPPPFGDLASARQACNAQYPPVVGNYARHAACVNEAVEAYALPTARYPDLIRLQEAVRSALSDRIDRRRLAVAAGLRQMAQTDRLIEEIERERERGDEVGANRRLARLHAMLR